MKAIQQEQRQSRRLIRMRNWGLEDPTGKSDDDFKVVIKQIEKNIIELRNREVQS